MRVSRFFRHVPGLALLILLGALVAGCASEPEANVVTPEDMSASQEAYARLLARTPDAALERLPPIDSLFLAYRAAGFSPLARDTASEAKWVRETLATLSTDEKIGQLFVVNLAAQGERAALRPAFDAIQRHHVGGFLVPRLLDPSRVADAVDTLQHVSVAASGVPLFMAADYERGVGRFSNTFTELPSNMALGAARDTMLAAAAGRLSAIEARAVGVNLLLAPVVDVNNNPSNPIINIRSYGEESALVGLMARAFVREAENYGLLTTLKHFPGHGNTSVDSHARMGSVASNAAELDSVELRPYRIVLEGDAVPAAVMSAHLWIEAIDDEPLPATFSRRAIRGLLRDSLGFEGIVITDDLKMGGVSQDYPLAERVLRPLEAGADILLTPGDLPAAASAIRRALASGRLTPARLDASVRRILRQKARAALYADARAQRSRLRFLEASPRGAYLAQAVADRAVTLLSSSAALPLEENTRAVAVHLTNYRGSESIAAATARFDDLLGARLDASARFEGDPSASERVRLLDAAKHADVVVVGLYLRLIAGRGNAGLDRAQAEFVRELLALETPVVFVPFGNPYAVATFAGGLGEDDAILVAYDQSIETIDAVASILHGEKRPMGQLPITVEGYPLRSGVHEF